MKKYLLLLVFSLFSLFSNLASGAEAAKSGKQKEIVLTIMTAAHPYFQGLIAAWEELAKENGFKLTVMDPGFDNAKLVKIVDDILVKNPDGVAFGPLEDKMSVRMIQKIKDSGIPVIAYNVKPGKDIVPVVVAGNYEGGKLAGENAAKMWKANNPDKKAVFGIVGQVGIPAVDDRENGFIEGFKSVLPDAEFKQKVNGYGVREKALKASEDLLQANPDINVIFGINDDSALAAADAFSQLNIKDPKKAIVAGVDGSEPAIQKLKDPNNVYKIEVGSSPKAMAKSSYTTLVEVMNGKKEFKETIVPFVAITPENADQWLSDSFGKGK